MRYVKYIGPSHQRQITARDWQTVGITADTVVWSAFNGFAVPLDQFSENQIRRAIEPDRFFVVTAGDEEFEPVYHTRAMTPDQADQVANNPVDVVEYANTGNRASTAVSGPSSTPGGRGDVADPDLEATTRDLADSSK